MQALVQDRYGGPEVLALEEVDRPSFGSDGILVRVRAASVNALDWHILRGEPYLVRLTEGLRRPKQAVRGVDFAGVVEAVGDEVTDAKPGDEVVGVRSGTFAEFVACRGRNVVPKPAGLTFEEAAAIPTAAETALQALRDKASLRAGQRVLVDGAGGGVGTFAVQLAHALGAHVTAVTGAANAELVGSIGADEVLDRERDDPTRARGAFDVVLDISGRRPLRAWRRALVPDGTLVVVAPAPGNWIGPVLHPVEATLLSRTGRRRFRPFLAEHRNDDLRELLDLAAGGTITPIVDRVYPLAQAVEAVRHVDAGRARGKVVISV